MWLRSVIDWSALFRATSSLRIPVIGATSFLKPLVFTSLPPFQAEVYVNSRKQDSVRHLVKAVNLKPDVGSRTDEILLVVPGFFCLGSALGRIRSQRAIWVT